MPTNFTVSEGTLYAFLLVLARIGGAFVLVPLPGMSTGADLARIVAAVTITIALLPFWPRFNSFPPSIAALVVAMLTEAVFGLAVGIAVACFNEIMKMAAQVMSTQAGYGYASTIDPSTSADSGLLVVAAQLISGLLFLALGLDREVVRVFAMSLVNNPPGVIGFSPVSAGAGEALWRYASDIFSVGVRLAMPSIALLALIDISLALLGRVNSQLQLISVSFPIKMLVTLILIAVIAATYPRVIGAESNVMLQISRHGAGMRSDGR